MYCDIAILSPFVTVLLLVPLVAIADFVPTCQEFFQENHAILSRENEQRSCRVFTLQQY